MNDSHTMECRGLREIWHKVYATKVHRVSVALYGDPAADRFMAWRRAT